MAIYIWYAFIYAYIGIQKRVAVQISLLIWDWANFAFNAAAVIHGMDSCKF
jgi:hypothetical protein